jgi:hypothetical protein
MVLTSSPSFTMGDSLPHLQSHRWMLYGTDDGDLEGLGWRDRLTFHAQTVLGLPRQLLSLLRANRTDPSAWAGTYGTLKVTRGIGRQPFRPFAPPPPSLDPAALPFRPGAADFVVEHDPLPAYQTHYFAKFFAVAPSRGAGRAAHVPLWVNGTTRWCAAVDWAAPSTDPSAAGRAAVVALRRHDGRGRRRALLQRRRLAQPSLQQQRQHLLHGCHHTGTPGHL